MQIAKDPDQTGVRGYIYPDAKKHDWNAGFVFIGGEHVLEELISNLREKGIVLIITEINNIKVED
jgi:hypothetical protein